MTLEITTPAVLFPTVSLLLLAYTNRFLALTAIVRQMDSSGEVEHEFYQVKNLRKRLNYIKRMQYFGVSSLLMCAISMLFLFFQMDFIGKISFGISLVSLIISLLFSLLEIQISLEALRIHLNHNSENEEKK
ncbi:hypothetical protein HMPREF3180_02367 [Leptotrichia wadei]|jgi:hypothetical protein|uniref:II family cellulose-binding protein n=2 Tax=Leptotrichia wadei TaxID=157687 RepID=A0A133ZVH3_9FUSO|nr:DUF2721 domain-containing protein [Leptotrichia wadei]ERK54380.1 hypothetical protein HMPREF9015_00075 [Leptotrichia wadei F0279]KXB59425.1 hypothetical protein HMPREF3180_02367 [Leptotrichia wadei]BBM42111.1 hypothetical protein JCM16777_0355 [Leptotrichia wadei]BBM46854.1 hypothetical protein JMUB3933_0349 [Leptotrichia wadei]